MTRLLGYKVVIPARVLKLMNNTGMIMYFGKKVSAVM